MIKNFYSIEIEQKMIEFYKSLSEKDKRRYAAIEVSKLPKGGIEYIALLFGCERRSIMRGIEELNDPEILPPKGKVRHIGGGRTPILDKDPNLDNVFLEVLRDYTAGNPMKEEVIWTNLSKEDIVERMKEKGTNVSIYIVEQLLKKHNYKKRKSQKMLSIGETKNRNEQFEKINSLREEYETAGNPIISIDTKKKKI